MRFPALRQIAAFLAAQFIATSTLLPAIACAQAPLAAPGGGTLRPDIVLPTITSISPLPFPTAPTAPPGPVATPGQVPGGSILNSPAGGNTGSQGGNVNSGNGNAQGDNTGSQLGQQETGPASPFATGIAAGQFDAKWRDVWNGSRMTRIPMDNWTVIARVAGRKLGGWTGDTNPDGQMAKGERSLVVNEEVAGALGLTSAEVVNAVSRFPTTSPIVFARYTPQTGQLRISAIKVIRKPDQSVEVLQADYTPHHGEIIKAQKLFTTPGERTAGTGYNPYRLFRGADNDPVWYNLGAGAAQVAAGWAIAHFRAAGGLFVEAKLRLDQVTRKGGGWLRRKITTTTTFYAQPKFYSMLPTQMSAQRGVQVAGITGNICVTGATTCDTADHVMYSGLILDEMSGGNMPDAETMLGDPMVETKRSWTVLAYTLLTAALVYAGGAMVAGEGQWFWASGAGPVGASAPGAAATAIAATGGQVAAIGGASYAAGAYVLSDANSLTAPQSSYLGKAGLEPEQIGNGYVKPPDCKNKYCKELGNRANQAQVGQRLVDVPTGNVNGLPGVKTAVGGNCSMLNGVEQCGEASQTTGAAPRLDSYMETNTVNLVNSRVASCRSKWPNTESREYIKCIAPDAVVPY